MDTKKRILFVIPTLVCGGSERVTALLANALADKDNDVRVLTLEKNEIFYEFDSSVQIVDSQLKIRRNSRTQLLLSNTKTFSQSLKAIKSNIDEFKPDVVISFLPKSDILVYLSKSKCRKFKHICSERNDPNQRAKIIQIALKRVYKHCDCFVAQSGAMAEFYGYVGKNKVVVIPNPISPNIAGLNYEGPRRKSIVAVGRLSEQKNYQLLVNSFKKICTLVPEYSLEIYGKGPLEKELLALIEDRQLLSRVKLMGARKNVHNLICDAHLYVMSSDYEGFPNALLEAMAIGLPVVSTDFQTGIAKELITDGINGMVVPVNDAEALSAAMLTMLRKDDNELEAISSENRKILDRFNVSTIKDKWMSIINIL